VVQELLQQVLEAEIDEALGAAQGRRRLFDGAPLDL
jgi:hypothetical protein